MRPQSALGRELAGVWCGSASALGQRCCSCGRLNGVYHSSLGWACLDDGCISASRNLRFTWFTDVVTPFRLDSDGTPFEAIGYRLVA